MGRAQSGRSAHRSTAEGAAADRVELTARYLRRRYVVNGLTATQIAAETGWSSQYVRDRLRDHGIPLRPRGLGKPRLGRDQLQGWVDAGLTVGEIAERAGYSTSGVRKLIGEFQIPIPERVRPPLAGQRLLDELAAKYARGQSLEALGAEYGHTADWARARLTQAGVAIRPPGSRRKITADQVRAGLDEGLRTHEIASRLGCSDWAVLQVMRNQGWTAPAPRHRGPSLSLPPIPAEPVLRGLYVEQQMTVAQVAAAVGISTTRITAALKRHGIALRKPGWVDGVPPPPITAEQLHQLYVQGEMRIDETAAALETTDTRVRAALRRHGIPIRPERRPLPPLGLTKEALTDLYVHQRLDDDQIGELHGVPPWRVRQRIRELGVHRPKVDPPRLSRPRPRRSTNSASCTPSRAAPRLRSGGCSTPPPCSFENGSSRPGFRSSLGPPEPPGPSSIRDKCVSCTSSGSGAVPRSPHTWTPHRRWCCAPCTSTTSRCAAAPPAAQPPPTPPD